MTTPPTRPTMGGPSTAEAAAAPSGGTPISWRTVARGLAGASPPAAGLAASKDARRLGASVLGMEMVVFWLAIIVASVQTDVGTAPAAIVGGVLAVGCVLVAGLLRRPNAYLAGTLLQVAAVASGAVVHTMYVVGVLFAVLWVAAVRLGLVAVRDAETQQRDVGAAE